MLTYAQLIEPRLNRLTDARGLGVHWTAKRGSDRLKADYVRSLEQADQDPTRLLSLPSELLRMIGEELLIFKDGQHSCHPRILATCKEINEKVSDILNDANVFHIIIIITKANIEALGKTCGRRVRSDCIEHLHWPRLLAQDLEASLHPRP